MKNISILSLLFTMTMFGSCSQKQNLHPAINTCPGMNIAAKTGKQAKTAISIYPVGGNWENSEGKPFRLIELKGKIEVIAMVFTRCQYACPRIVGDIKTIESELSANVKSQVGFVLVSFDSKRDTSARLSEYAKEMGLGSEWTLLHGDEESVRNLSMVLDVKYEKHPDGGFTHGNVITVLDTNGTVIYRQEGLEENDSLTVDAINKLAR
jgi:protein SCO1/2